MTSICLNSAVYVLCVSRQAADRMYDWSVRLQQGTPRRGCAADEDAVRAMGFHDCALEALRFLTERARLDPDSAVVQDVRGLLDGPTDAARVTSAAADINVSSVVRRVRRRTRNVSEDENRSLTARRCLHGRVSRQRSQRNRSRCQGRFIAHVDDGLLTSPSLPDCAAVVDRPTRSTTSVRGDASLRQCPLRILQTTAAPSRSSTSTVSADVQFCQDVEVTTASDVVDCAAMLVDLARRDDRVRNVLTELLQLMD